MLRIPPRRKLSAPGIDAPVYSSLKGFPSCIFKSLGPVNPSFRALSGRLKCTVLRCVESPGIDAPKLIVQLGVVDCGNRRTEVDRSGRLLIVPLFRGSSRFESLILSHHSRFTCECNKEDINDDDDDDVNRVKCAPRNRSSLRVNRAPPI